MAGLRSGICPISCQLRHTEVFPASVAGLRSGSFDALRDHDITDVFPASVAGLRSGDIYDRRAVIVGTGLPGLRGRAP